MRNISKVDFVRYSSSLVLSCVLIWDLYRDFQEGIKKLSIWALMIHFLYFQLPLKSKAVAFFHPISFSASVVIPALYAYILVCKPSYELDHVDMWDLSWRTIVCRSFLIHFVPLIFHTLDVTKNQEILINAYRMKPRKLQEFLAYFGYCIFEIIFEFTITETEDLPGISKRDFSQKTKIISVACSFFSSYVLYLLILQRAFSEHYGKMSHTK